MKPNSASSQSRLLRWSGGVAVLVGAALFLFDRTSELQLEAAQQPPPSFQVSTNPPSREADFSHSYANVVERIAPAVVSVYSTRIVESATGMGMGPFGDPLFRRFFGDQFDEPEPREAPGFRQRGLGSGVVVTKEGYILTNEHVVEDADEIKVSLNGSRKEYTATLVGRDAKTDLAVLKIEAGELPFATLADSDHIRVGDVVLAVGNPFGIGQTTTMGIISATRRGGMGIEHYEDFIQTDAAINPGNSGGALVDVQGRVIGICTAILSRSGGNQGVGFAVPINLAKSVMDQIIKTGRVVRGYLGVSIQALTPELAKQFKVPDGDGALVGGVVEDGAAAEAGLKSGDVIVELNGKPIEDSRQLMLEIGSKAPGTKVNVKVMRDGRSRNFTVTLKEMPDETYAERDDSEPRARSFLEGVTISNITSAYRRQLDLPADVEGALVTRVNPASAAHEAGLRSGNVIQEIDRKPVRNAEDALEASKQAKGDEILLRIWSSGGSRYLVVQANNNK